MFDFFLYPHFLLPERGSSRSREKTCRASFWSHSSGLFPVVAGAWRRQSGCFGYFGSLSCEDTDKSWDGQGETAEGCRGKMALDGQWFNKSGFRKNSSRFCFF